MSAVLSECGKYRFRLEREVGMEGPTFAYFGVNPSTADAMIDDATVRKWTGFTKVYGGRRFIVGNVFAYRATDVRELRSVADHRTADNAAHIQQIAADADILVPCWGAISKVTGDLHHHFVALRDLLRGTGKPVMAFGLTADGSPKHPLMLGYSTQLIDWAAR